MRGARTRLKIKKMRSQLLRDREMRLLCHLDDRLSSEFDHLRAELVDIAKALNVGKRADHIQQAAVVARQVALQQAEDAQEAVRQRLRVVAKDSSQKRQPGLASLERQFSIGSAGLASGSLGAGTTSEEKVRQLAVVWL